MTVESLEKLREQIHLIRPRTFYDLKSDTSNLDDILNEYRAIGRVGRKLSVIDGNTVEKVLVTQSSEVFFFKAICLANLKCMVDYYDELLKHKRGIKYTKISTSNSRNLNDRAITTIVDGDVEIFDATQTLLKVKDVHYQFLGIVDSYQQRGYSLNNLMKAFDLGAAGHEL